MNLSQLFRRLRRLRGRFRILPDGSVRHRSGKTPSDVAWRPMPLCPLNALLGRPVPGNEFQTIAAELSLPLEDAERFVRAAHDWEFANLDERRLRRRILKTLGLREIEVKS